MKKKGSRIEVMNGIAEMTGGGLKKKDLIYKDGKIISKKMNKKIYKQRGGGSCKDLAYSVYNALNNTRLNHKNSNNDNKVLEYITKKRTFADSSEIPTGDNRPDFIILLEKYIEDPSIITDDILINQVRYFLEYLVDSEKCNITFKGSYVTVIPSNKISNFYLDYEDLFIKITNKITEKINEKNILIDSWHAMTKNAAPGVIFYKKLKAKHIERSIRSVAPLKSIKEAYNNLPNGWEPFISKTVNPGHIGWYSKHLRHSQFTKPTKPAKNFRVFI